MPSLHGKSIKLRISGFNRNLGGWRKGISEGTVARTLGIPVSGDPPEIEIKPMIPGADIVLIPLRYLEPVHPWGAQEKAVCIAGDHQGAVVTVVEAGEPLWRLAPFDNPRCPLYTAPREHLVILTNLLVS
jgi:hypothetical protein